jgi:hypothetical protein
MTTPGFGILMLLATTALAFGLILSVIGAQLRGRAVPWRRLGLVAGGWAAGYALILLATSLLSKERALGWGADKEFCGFYLDCHRRVAVVAVAVVDSIGALGADGRFHVVTLRVGSDARAVRLRLHEPDVVVRAQGRGRPFARSAAGEAALRGLRAPELALTDEIGPGGAFATTVVFDLPRDLPDPRLDVTDLPWPDRLIEFILIGDEDSFLHARTTIRLSPAS